MSKARYEIDENNTIRIWKNEELSDGAPVLLQPFSPDTGKPWNSREEAEQWAINMCGAYDSHDYLKNT